MVLLTSTMLVRSSSELQASNLVKDAQQSFWLTETAVDAALFAMRTNPPVLADAQCTTTVQGLLTIPARAVTTRTTADMASLPNALDGMWSALTMEETAEARITTPIELDPVTTIDPGTSTNTAAVTLPSPWNTPYTYQVCQLAEGQFQIDRKSVV